MKTRKQQWFVPVINFATHAAVGTMIFLIVGLPAVGLNLLVHALQAAGLSGFTLTVLQWLEHAIVLVDAVLAAIYTFLSTWREIKEMLNEPFQTHQAGGKGRRQVVLRTAAGSL